MEYLVMECGLSYAVVLDSEGRFQKVPNLGYEVGQTLSQVVLTEDRSRNSAGQSRLFRWAAAAACLCVVILGSWGLWQSPIGTVRMQINPDVQMRVNRFDRVVGLEGLNEDGQVLVDGYRAYGKEMKAVSDALADRAVEQGYLQDGGKILLTVESGREGWKTATEELLLLELDLHLGHQVTVETASGGRTEPPQPPTGSEDVIIIHPGQVDDAGDWADDDLDDREDDGPDGDSGHEDDGPGDQNDDSDDRGENNASEDEDDDDGSPGFYDGGAHSAASSSGDREDDDDGDASSDDDDDPPSPPNDGAAEDDDEGDDD